VSLSEWFPTLWKIAFSSLSSSLSSSSGRWLDPEDEDTMIAAPETTHPATQCHIPEDLNL